MTITYSNPLFKGGKGYGPKEYIPERKIESVNGFDIYYRAGCYDIVRNGECMMQVAGANYARAWANSN